MEAALRRVGVDRKGIDTASDRVVMEVTPSGEPSIRQRSVVSERIK